MIERNTQMDGRPNDEIILDFIVYGRCDVANLSIDVLISLREERKALQELRTALKSVATSIPEVVTGRDYREQFLRDAVNDALKQWAGSRNTFGSFGRKFFSEDSLKQPETLITKIMEKAVSEPVAGAMIGGLTNGSLLGSLYGFAVGVAMHAVRSAWAVRKEQGSSPYRYLTMMERNGVVFSTTSKPIRRSDPQPRFI